MTTALVRMVGITKRFPGTVALDDVSFELLPGEVHVLMGANGAGKSTLIKILSGVYSGDEGTIYLDGRATRIRDPHHAQALGISTIYQDINLVPQLTVAENLNLGREPRVAGLPFLNKKAAHRYTFSLFNQLGLSVEPRAKVGLLSLAEQQLVAIARALSIKAKVLILDEPTAVLSSSEIDNLFILIRTLRNQGIGIVYISHRLEEARLVGDRATVLRDGRSIATVSLAEKSIADLIELIVGRQMRRVFDESGQPQDRLVLEVNNITKGGTLNAVTFQVRAGEIVGVTGILGSGKEELARALFGDLPGVTGSIRIGGQTVDLRSPRRAVRNGVGYMPSDRRGEGLVLSQSVRDNITLASLQKYSVACVLPPYLRNRISSHFVDSLDIKTNSINTLAQFLSGGNQQKTVLAKWLATNSRVLVLVEPTNGLDVGAKAEVYHLVHELAKAGTGVVLIASELPEVLGLSHRILVMRRGRIVAEFDRTSADEHAILHAAISENTAPSSTVE
jgi:ribose transport system ATP-binding protein